MKKTNKKQTLKFSLTAMLIAIIMLLGACAPTRMPSDVARTMQPSEDNYSEPAATAEHDSDIAMAPEYSPEYVYDGNTGDEWYEPEPSYYPNNEEYKQYAENGFVSTKSNPLSTFSADVDSASYANMRRMINDGQIPNPDAIRVEEMINYFSYSYPQPEGGEPFAMSAELTQCPWNKENKLLMLGMQAKDTTDLSPANLVFLIDVSGSMDEPDKLPLLKQAFLMLTQQLRPQDKVSIVTYSSKERIVLDSVSGDQKALISKAVQNLRAGGSTNGEAGMQMAYELAEKNYIKNGNNRIVMATDGDLNVGISSEEELHRYISEKRKTGIYLSVMGFGTENIKDNKMQTLADNGNGNYSYIDSVLEAQKVLVEEMNATLYTVAKDVKFQVEFNPKRVSAYRLIGYEKRKLNDSDFSNDKKDAGEVGSGHQVTVLYEIIDSGSDSQPVLKYQENKSSEPSVNDEWLTVSVRYKAPNGNESKLISYPLDNSYYKENMSDNMKFASAVAATGMLLKNSQYSGTATYDGILSQLDSVSNLNSDVYRDEFRYLVSQMSRYR